MPMGNPRGGADQETLRVQEYMGGFRPREMVGDYDVNPNDNADGLSHYNREGSASEETRTQLDPEQRKRKALRELEGELPHISIKPEEIGEILSRNPQVEQESQLLETGLGIDMGHASNGIGISQGANVGPVRREGPGLIFGRSSDTPLFLSDIVKGKRKKRGRKYDEDEDGEKDEKKAKKKRKRKRKREMKRGKKEASRDIKGKTKRRAGNIEQNISRNPKEQAFSPRRMLGANPRASGIPLRIRDPVAYQRKLASEKFRRQMGALPRGHSAHADTRGITGEKVQTIGVGGKGTKLPVPSQYGQGAKGTSLSQFKPSKAAMASAVLGGDPLSGDPLKMEKRATMQISARDVKGLNRSELLELKREVKKLVAALDKLNKATPELDHTAKKGSTAGGATDPQGGTENRDAEHPMTRFVDLSRGANGHLVSAK